MADWLRSTRFLTRLALLWILLLVVAAVFADVLPFRDPEALGIRTGEVERFESPGANAWFGGDELGRDLFANVVHGARPALLLALGVTVAAALVGSGLGIAAAYLRGKVDGAIMALVDTALAFPALILLAAVLGTIGRDLWVLAGILAILGVPTYARVVRGATLSLVEREFVEAARAMGASRWRVIWRELVPNIAIPVGSFAFLGIAIVIATEGGLAFIGLSLEQTTWGGLIAQGSQSLREASHLALIPATVMFLTILAFNLVGDSLQAYADPRPGALGRKRPPPPAHPSETSSVRHDPAGLLEVRNLVTELPTPLGIVRAVDGVDLSVEAGSVVGVVGESGSGKTMLLRSLLDTFPLAGVTRTGQVTFDGTDLLHAPETAKRQILGNDIGAVFQNPMTALNPVHTIGAQITEPMRVHRDFSKADARRRAIQLLAEVGISEPHKRLGQYPHQLSGGMRQRVTIAIALANEPRLLLADEPTTALDVTVQDQILTLLADLCRQREMALVLVTHDLSVVRGWTDRVAVMYGGQIVEQGETADIFERPQHRYTEALLRSIPRLDLPPHSELEVIEGQPPLLIDPPEGCRFAPRCHHADDQCAQSPVPTGSDTHRVACWHPASTQVEVRSDGR